jgi:hypothetical protein
MTPATREHSSNTQCVLRRGGAGAERSGSGSGSGSGASACGDADTGGKGCGRAMMERASGVANAERGGRGRAGWPKPSGVAEAERGGACQCPCVQARTGAETDGATEEHGECRGGGGVQTKEGWVMSTHDVHSPVSHHGVARDAGEPTRSTWSRTARGSQRGLTRRRTGSAYSWGAAWPRRGERRPLRPLPRPPRPRWAAAGSSPTRAGAGRSWRSRGE